MADRSRTPAVSRAVAVLSLLARSHGPLTVTAIARELGAPRTSVHGICETLADERMLVRGTDGSYWIGPRVAVLGANARLSAHHALRFGLLIPNLENTYYTALVSAAEDDVRATGGELIVCQADDDSDKQRRQWQTLINGRADVILIDAVDTFGFDDLVVRSRTAGIPVVAAGTRIDEVDVAVVSDNTQAGLLAGLELARRLPDGSSIAIADGLRKNANADRVAGFLDAIRDHRELTLVAHERGRRDDATSGREVAERLLSEHPSLSGIFAVCDPIALGVTSYLNSVGRPIPVTAVDGRAQVIHQIRDGGPIVATAAQDPARLVRAALDSARQLHDGSRPQQRVVMLPVRLIDATTAAGYQPWG